eukprot:6208044-Pleurochrysis_carterae.AAC.2
MAGGVCSQEEAWSHLRVGTSCPGRANALTGTRRSPCDARRSAGRPRVPSRWCCRSQSARTCARARAQAARARTWPGGVRAGCCARSSAHSVGARPPASRECLSCSQEEANSSLGERCGQLPVHYTPSTDRDRQRRPAARNYPDGRLAGLRDQESRTSRQQ